MSSALDAAMLPAKTVEQLAHEYAPVICVADSSDEEQSADGMDVAETAAEVVKAPASSELGDVDVESTHFPTLPLGDSAKALPNDNSTPDQAMTEMADIIHLVAAPKCVMENFADFDCSDEFDSPCH
jgi:hypothetical protein